MAVHVTVNSSITVHIPPLTQVTNELPYRKNYGYQVVVYRSQPTITHLPSCWTEEWSRERSRELSSSNSLKEESSSSVFWPSLPAIFSLARRSWTSSRVVAPPDESPGVCVCECTHASTVQTPSPNLHYCEKGTQHMHNVIINNIAKMDTCSAFKDNRIQYDVCTCFNNDYTCTCQTRSHYSSNGVLVS